MIPIGYVHVHVHVCTTACIHVHVHIQTVSVKEGEGEDLLTSYAGDMDPSHRRKRYMAISKCVTTVFEFIFIVYIFTLYMVHILYLPYMLCYTYYGLR